MGHGLGAEVSHSGLTCCRPPGTLLRNEATSGSQIPNHQLEEECPEELLDMLDFG